MINTKYIILCWIVLLIIFTFFCIYKLFVCKHNNNNNNTNTNNTDTNNTVINTARQNISNNFYDIPVTNTTPNKEPIINYINNILINDKIYNLEQCKDIYDDDYAVKALGYNSCKSANSDYFSNNMDATQKYGHIKSLSEMCPISTNSDKYTECMRQLLNKFNTNTDIVNTINKDMTSIINERINKRSDVLDNYEYSLKNNIPNNIINTLNTLNTINTNDINPNSNTYYNNIAEKAYTYYQTKYNYGKSIFDNIDNNNVNDNDNNNNNNNIIVDKFDNNLITGIPVATTANDKNLLGNDSNNDYILNELITKTFYGYYTPIRGQFLAFNNLTIMLNYQLPYDNIYGGSGVGVIANNNSKLQEYTLVFIIKDNITQNQITYKVTNVDYYLNYKTIIQFDIKKIITISNNDNNLNKLKTLLETLGLRDNSKLLLSVINTTSTENITHTTYKLFNVDMQQHIMQLTKI